MRRFFANYVQRHQNAWNQCLHLLGVPLTFVGSPIFLALGREGWAIGAFLAGYALQFLGHAIEGNDAGESILVKRLFGLSYQEFGSKTEVKPAELSKSND